MPRYVSPHGHHQVGADGANVPWSLSTLAALKALPAVSRSHGQEETVQLTTGFASAWIHHSTSALAGDDIAIADCDAGVGVWLRKPGFVDLALPFTFATADTTVLWTVPTGCIFKLESAYWEITTAMTGGSSAAIGLSATGHATQGDILGGATGDVLATLTAGVKAGTIGAKMDTDLELHSMIFVATNTFIFDAITSAFTAGAGNVHLVGNIVKNAGA
jgi:hypothetical protein